MGAGDGGQLQWAETQNNLATALIERAQDAVSALRGGASCEDPALDLSRAAAHYEKALEVKNCGIGGAFA